MSDRRCDTCNRPVGATDMQYERDGAVWCETRAPEGAFNEEARCAT